jgi:hypothetical protein
VAKKTTIKSELGSPKFLPGWQKASYIMKMADTD